MLYEQNLFFTGGSFDVGGSYNISSDQNFTSDGYHIISTSPCKDTGDHNGSYTGQKDIDNQDRVYNSRVDMGADEYHTYTAHRLISQMY